MRLRVFISNYLSLLGNTSPSIFVFKWDPLCAQVLATPCCRGFTIPKQLCSCYVFRARHVFLVNLGVMPATNVTIVTYLVATVCQSTFVWRSDFIIYYQNALLMSNIVMYCRPFYHANFANVFVAVANVVVEIRASTFPSATMEGLQCRVVSSCNAV